jgi:hypothetical protein
MLGAFFAKDWVTVTSRRVMSMYMRDETYPALISAFQTHVFEHFSPVLPTQYKSSYFICMQPQHPENYTCHVTEACVLASSRTVATSFNKLDGENCEKHISHAGLSSEIYLASPIYQSVEL